MPRPALLAVGLLVSSLTWTLANSAADPRPPAAPTRAVADRSERPLRTSDATKQLMFGIADEFADVEQLLAEERLEEIAPVAQALGTSFGHLPMLEEILDGDRPEVLRVLIARITSGAELLGAAASAGDREIVDAVVHDIRASCVDCHVRFRDGERPSGIFPDRDGIVSGTVRVVKTDGTETSDPRGVVVFLEPVDRSLRPSVPVHTRVLSQRHRQFSPRVLPIVAGTTVEFPNDDTIFHNAFSLSRVAPFDLGIYNPGHTGSVTFEESGLVKVYCNIHPQMSASILVLENDLFSTTDQRGVFVVPCVPAGTYRLRTWHEFGPETRREIVVGPETHRVLELTVVEDRKIAEHPNKFGKPYEGKYR